MKQLEQRRYEEYEAARKNAGNSGITAERLFTELMELPAAASDFESMSEEQFEPYKRALDSLRVNGEPMKFGPEGSEAREEPTTRENFRERMTEAVNKISEAMVKTDSILVPYVQKEDGKCEAIVPAVSEVTIPEKPSWYKRWFKGVVGSWRDEVNAYNDAVENAKKQETAKEYGKKLEERARKRELQTAAKDAGTIEPGFREEIKVFFGKEASELNSELSNNYGRGFKNRGRENLPLAMACGLMMAEENMNLDEVLQAPDEKKREYGNKVVAMFRDLHNICDVNVNKETMTDAEFERTIGTIKNTFKDTVAPALVKITAAYGAQSIRPVDAASPESIRTNGSYNSKLAALGQGVLQTFSNTLSRTEPMRVQMCVAYGEVIQEMALDAEKNHRSGPLDQALKTMANPPMPREEGVGALMAAIDAQKSWTQLPEYSTPAGQRKAESSLNSARYGMLALENILPTVHVSRLKYTELFSSCIEGRFVPDQNLDMTDILSSISAAQGNSLTPESVSRQQNRPFYENAYVRKSMFDLNFRRYDPIDRYGTHTSEELDAELSRQLEAIRAGGAADNLPLRSSTPDNETHERMMKDILEFENTQSRLKTSLNELEGAQAAAPQRHQEGPARANANTNTRQAARQPRQR